jgi:hypothetical protein
MPFHTEGVRWDKPTVTWSFAELDLDARLASSFAGYPDFEAPVPAAFRDAVRSAFKTWDQISNLDFVEVSDSIDADIRVGQRDLPEHSAGGVAHWWATGGRITKAAVAVDIGSSDAHHFYLVALHEIGHVLGLSHSQSPADIMYPVVTYSLTGPSADEVSGLRSLYGPEQDHTAASVSGFSRYGTEGSDQVLGGSGDDIMYGIGGNDLMAGNAGNDTVFGGAGVDWVLGGVGNDSLFGDHEVDNMFGEAGVDAISGGAGNDGLFGGDGNDVIAGDDGNDAMNGDAGDDLMIGGVGSDQIVGGAGVDALFGFAGDDGLYGGDGNDRIDGGAGVDGLFGGFGNDTFVFDVGSGGLDVVFDGQFGAGAGDLIAVQGAGSGVDFASMLSRAYETGGVVVIPFNNVTGIYLVGYTITSLSADDFAFI